MRDAGRRGCDAGSRALTAGVRDELEDFNSVPEVQSMQILEHGAAEARRLLFFPCTAEPVWMC